MWKPLGGTYPQQIHAASMSILSRVGVAVHHDEALDILAAGGATVRNGRVFLSEEVIAEYLKRAPKTFTLRAPNPARDITVGAGVPVLAPGYGAPYVAGIDGVWRLATMDDYVRFVKLVHSSAHLGVNGGVLVEPSDVPLELRHLEMMGAALRWSDKCLMGPVVAEQGLREIMPLLTTAFGSRWGEVKAEPCLICVVNPLTPLTYDDRMASALMAYARAGQAIIVASAAMTGLTSPVTLAGTLAVQNAEVLTGIVLAQMVRPGTPVIYGSASAGVDMRYASLCVGAPETALLVAASVGLAHFYGLPCRAGGALTDAKTPDAQSGYESMLILLASLWSGADFVLHSAGILHRYLAMSYEKFVLDEEACAIVLRTLCAFDVSEATLALDEIFRVGPGGEFVTSTHTLQWHSRELWRSVLFDRTGYEGQHPEGVLGLLRRAGDLARERIASCREPVLSEQQDGEVQEYLSEARRRYSPTGSRAGHV